MCGKSVLLFMLLLMMVHSIHSVRSKSSKHQKIHALSISDDSASRDTDDNSRTPTPTTTISTEQLNQPKRSHKKRNKGQKKSNTPKNTVKIAKVDILNSIYDNTDYNSSEISVETSSELGNNTITGNTSSNIASTTTTIQTPTVNMQKQDSSKSAKNHGFFRKQPSAYRNGAVYFEVGPEYTFDGRSDPEQIRTHLYDPKRKLPKKFNPRVLDLHYESRGDTLSTSMVRKPKPYSFEKRGPKIIAKPTKPTKIPRMKYNRAHFAAMH